MKPIHKVKSILACFLIAALCLQTSEGAVSITGNPAAGTGLIEITKDIEFTISATGEFWILVFDEWVTSDGTQTQSSQTPVTLAYSLNGVDSTLSDLQFVDNLTFSAGDLTENDGYLATATDPVAVVIGDTFIIKAGIWAMAGDPELNPDIIGVFEGNAFLTDDNGIRISNVVAVPVPEPSSTFLFLCSAVLMIARRRRI